MTPPVQAPAGGTNHIYRLCQIAEEHNIHARVLSPEVYQFADPPELKKYWQYAENTFDGIKEGDIVVSPEMWPSKPNFGVPIRRVMYIQNWAISHPRQPWEKIYLYYGGEHLNYAISRTGVIEVPHTLLRPDHMVISDTKNVIEADKVSYYKVQPYFDYDDYADARDKYCYYDDEAEKRGWIEPWKDYGHPKKKKILLLSRKLPDVVKAISCEHTEVVDSWDPKDTAELMASYSVIVITSAAEGLCFPAIEAMLSGTAVVSWPCGAPEEYLIDGETAKMVPFGDVDALQGAAIALLHDPDECARLAGNANELAREMFTKEETSRQLYLAYHSILRHRPEL